MTMESKLASLEDVSGKTFDFVIIGGGVAGCVLAARLSELPDVSVALLEAGNSHFDDPLISEPLGWMKQVFDSEYDWNFRTTTQTRAQNGVSTPDGKPDPSFYWARGKGLGGSSCINFLYWTRPQLEEIEAIERLGNHGWSWERFFEASRRTESFYETPATNDADFLNLHKETSIGRNGPVPVSFTRTCSKAELPFQKAMEACGVKLIDDGLSGSLTGSFKCLNSLDPRTGTRSTAATAYLIPALDRPNLKVLTGAYVHKVLVRSQGGETTATGVEFSRGGKTYSVRARKEVILSASTVKSPQILELSGIGDPRILQSLGIPVQVDLPSVGTNLQDHLILTGSIFMMRDDKGIVTTDTLSSPEVKQALREAYGDVILPDGLTGSGVGFVPLQQFSGRAEKLITELEKRLESKGKSFPPGLREQYTLQLEMLKDERVPDIEIVVFPFNLHPDGSGKPFIGLMPSIGHPFSRGTIHSVSDDPAVQPQIEPNYFDDDFDLDILVESVKFIRKLAATNEWQSVSSLEIFPGMDSNASIREFIRTNVSTTWHSCGTCSMMPKDKGGVVDTHLKVYGTSNIRVVDLSVLPLITAVHTQATTYAIAEQAAEIIRTDNSL